MFQTKELDETSEKDLNKTEISNIPDIELKEMLTELKRRMDEHSESYIK